MQTLSDVILRHKPKIINGMKKILLIVGMMFSLFAMHANAEQTKTTSLCGAYLLVLKSTEPPMVLPSVELVFDTEDKSDILCSGSTDIDIDFPGLSMPCMFRSKVCFAIDPKGDIYKCIEHLGSPKNKIGSIIEQRMSVAKIANCALENDPFADSQCEKCSVLPICGGGCPIDRINQKKGIIRNCCSKYKDTIQELLPHLYNIKYAKL